MSISRLLLLLLLGAQVPSPTLGNNQKPPNPSKLKTNLSKMRNTEARNQFKQQQTVKAQSYSPRFGVREKGHSSSDALRHAEYQAELGDKPVFQLFVRRRQTGPWFRYENLREDDPGVQSTCEEIVLNGGLEAEALRTRVDAYMIAKIFGEDSACSPLTINKIKGSLSLFKKVRPRDFEIGYRLAAEGEDICSLTSIVEAQASATSLPSPPAIPAAMLDVKALLSAHPPMPLSALRLQHQVSAFASMMLAQQRPEVLSCGPAMDLYLCSDGSALACAGGGGWQDASAGVFAMCVARVDGVVAQQGGAAAAAPGGEQPSHVDSETSSEPNNLPNLDPRALRLRISNVAPVVESPFDAELVAGMAAAALASSIVAAMPTGCIGSIMLLTDSKTLVRACRTGPAGNPELAGRGPQRQVLWEMLMAVLQRLDSAGTPLTVQWTSGHPERRGGPSDSWTFEDVAIWEADDIARPQPCSGGERERMSLDLKDLLVLMQTAAGN